jgi:CBS domain-containing protein
MTAFMGVRAGEIMSRTLVCASPEQDLAQLDEILIEQRIGGVPVVDDGKLVGVVSRSDVARVQVLMNSLDGLVTDRLRWMSQADGFEHSERPEFKAFRSSIGGLKVKDVMHHEVVTCTPDERIVAVAEMMVRQHIHRVIVVDGQRPVGVISSLDLARLIAELDSKAHGDA